MINRIGTAAHQAVIASRCLDAACSHCERQTYLRGEVQHRGLLCGTYILSLRVGQGNPGCTNVQWFNEPRAVASLHLCNNDTGKLTGGNLEFADAAHFDEITCAERTASSSGNCK